MTSYSHAHATLTKGIYSPRPINLFADEETIPHARLPLLVGCNDSVDETIDMLAHPALLSTNCRNSKPPSTTTYALLDLV